MSYNVEQVLRENRAIDYVMYGESEQTFCDVMNGYDKLQQIKGIGFRNGEEIFISILI